MKATEFFHSLPEHDFVLKPNHELGNEGIASWYAYTHEQLIDFAERYHKHKKKLKKEKKQSNKKQEFKVGDVVRVINGDNHSFPIGYFVELISFDGDFCICESAQFNHTQLLRPYQIEHL